MEVIFLLAKCPSRANFDTSHDWFAKNFNFGPILGPFEAKGVLLGALGAQKRPDTRSMCLLTMIPAQSYQLAAVGTKAGPSGPSKSLWSPQKGLLGPKKALLGALGAQKRPDTRSKCLVTIIPAQSDQLAAVWTKSGLSGSSKSLWAPKRAFRGQNGPWSAVEVR